MFENSLMIDKSLDLLKRYSNRRSCRIFSSKIPPKDAIINCIKCASLAPSGANMQPWTFVLISDPAVKSLIRQKAEEIEYLFYNEHISAEWSDKLKPLNLDYTKPFLEHAPYLICVFAQNYSFDETGDKVKHYYVQESVGISIGFLINALHEIGLSSLTYTPSPMKFLNEILKRPSNEKPVMIIPVGYASEEYIPPNITKKELDKVLNII